MCRKFTKIKGLFCRTVIFPFPKPPTLFFNCNGTKIKFRTLFALENIDGMEKDVRWRLRVASGWYALLLLLMGGFFGYKSQLHNIFSTREVEKKIASSLPDECPMKGHLIRNYVHWPKGNAL